MATVMITCPVTERLVSTGLIAEKNILASSAEIFVPMRCTSCGQLHFWCMKQACVINDDTPHFSARQ